MVLVLDQRIHVQVKYLLEFLTDSKACLRVPVAKIPYRENVVLQTRGEYAANNIRHGKSLANTSNQKVLPHPVDIAL